MKASGWDEDVALDALETTMRDHLEAWRRRPRRCEPRARRGRCPAPRSARARRRRAPRDRDVRVLMSMAAPRIVVFGDLLSADECDELIALARSRLARSETVETTTGASEVNAARTSDGMFFERASSRSARASSRASPRCSTGRSRTAKGCRSCATARAPSTCRTTTISIRPSPARRRSCKRGGQRVASLVCYLNTPEAGGATIFPDIGLEVAPVQGNAVFFSYDRPHPSTRTLHGGAPVTAGEKWVATRWLREGMFE